MLSQAQSVNNSCYVRVWKEECGSLVAVPWEWGAVGAFGMNGLRGFGTLNCTFGMNGLGLKKAIATLHMHSQPRSKGWGEEGEFSSRVGPSGRGNSDFRLGPRNYRIDIPNTQPIFMTMSSTLPYVYFGPWTRPPPPLRLFCHSGKATLATPGYTMVRYRATPGFARQQTKINVTPPLVFTSSST